MTRLGDADWRVLDEGYKLVVWGMAESATAIMASSIPVLRVLIRDVKSTTFRKYGISAGVSALDSTDRMTAVTSGGDNSHRKSFSKTYPQNSTEVAAHNWKDTSVLDMPMAGDNKILSIKEIDIRYDKADDAV
jgi:hypothetical protein